MATQKVWLITGAAKGFGLEFVKAALESGDQVIATVRSKPEQLADTLNHPADLFIVLMDVTDEAQIKAAVQQGVAHFGRLDVVINNVGYGLMGALRLHQICRAGHFAGVGCGAGALGIHVTDVAPGLFSTEFVSLDFYATAGNPIADYDATPVGQLRTNIARFHKAQPGDPQKLAQVVIQLVASAPPLHLPIGPDAVTMYQQSVAKLAQEITPWLALASNTDHVKAEA